jgi:hypothetical protein
VINPAIIVSVDPVDAGVIVGDPNMRWDEGTSAIDVDGHMHVEVRVALVGALTGNAVYREIDRPNGRASRCPSPREEADDHDHTCGDDTDGCDTTRAPDVLPRFFMLL